MRRLLFVFLFLGFLSVAEGQQIETLSRHSYRYNEKTTFFLGKIVKQNPEARVQLAKSRVMILSAVGMEMVGTGFILSGLLDGLGHGGSSEVKELKKQRISKNLKIGIGLVVTSIPIGFLSLRYRKKAVTTFNQNNLTQHSIKDFQLRLAQTINGYGLVLTF